MREPLYAIGDLLTLKPYAHLPTNRQPKLFVVEVLVQKCYADCQVHYSCRVCQAGSFSTDLADFVESEVAPAPPLTDPSAPPDWVDYLKKASDDIRNAGAKDD